MVGFGRLVTDYVTVGYLTDVYVVTEHQGKGLGKWMMQCLDEVLESWPNLRRCMLLTRGAAAVKMYGETIGARDISETSPSLVVLERPGPDAPMAGGNGKTKGEKGE
jgi:GNAT superfamily N-acetyltransferase